MCKVEWSTISWTLFLNITLPSSRSPILTTIDNEGMAPRAGDVMFVAIAGLAFWTLAYQLVLVTRLPAWAILPIFACLLFGSLWAGRRIFGKNPWTGYEFHFPHLFLVILGFGCAVLVLFVLRPNQDDVVYFHRALTQLDHLSDPILTRQTSVDVDAAAFSPVHLATSHEILMAFLGHFLGIDPLYFYQVIGHVIAAFAIPFVFYFCARCFGVSRASAAAGAFCVVVFLLTDDSGPSSFGGTAFTRMWQGKSVVWILAIPVAISLTHRFLKEGQRVDILWLTLLGISGVGLSNSALYLLPAAVGSAGLVALSVQLVFPHGDLTFRALFRRSLLLAIPLIYPVGTLFLIAVNIIPKPINRQGFGPEFIPWAQAIRYVVGQNKLLWRDLVILLTVPCLILRGKKGLFLLLYSVIIFIFCLNPLLAHFWMKNITAACYFRLVYLMPLPLAFVFLPQAIQSGPKLSWRSQGWGVIGALLIVAFVVFSFRSLAIAPRGNGLGWKSPGDLQIRPENMAFARAAHSYLVQSKLLAPAWTASCELPLLFPHMKVVAPRLAIHYFANAGKGREGALRRMAQAYVEGEKTTNKRRAAALLRSFETIVKSDSVTAIAVPAAQSARVMTTLRRVDPRWRRVLEAGGLVLLLPQAQNSSRPARSSEKQSG